MKIYQDEFVKSRLSAIAKAIDAHFPKPKDNRKSLTRNPRWRSAMHVYMNWAKDCMYMRKYFTPLN